MNVVRSCIAAAALLAAAACTPSAVEVDDVLQDLEAHVGKKVVVRTRLRSGARCRVGDGEFKTYCKDCQFCKGPLVVDTGAELPETVADWPLILGGTHDGQPIRCEGPLNEVECHPFELGKTYVIRGSIEATQPPKLLVSDFWTE